MEVKCGPMKKDQGVGTVVNNILYRTLLFRTRLIRSPRYFEGRSNALGFTLPLYASPVISKPAISNFFSFPLGLRNSGVRLSQFRISNGFQGCKIKKGESKLLSSPQPFLSLALRDETN